jgi:LuxR family maltose regulon positive regulatory protein
METLREKNLFLVPLDYHKEWYRYHALFADMLRNHLYRTRGDLVDGLHLRASRWYQENELLIPAIEHAFSGQAYEQAAGLLEQAVEPIFISGQIVTLLRWLDLLPDDAKKRHPMLWIYHGLALIWGGNTSPAVKPFLPELVSIFTANGLIGEAQLLQALVTMSAGKPLEAEQLAQSALRELPAERTLFRCLAADTLGMVKIMQSDTAGAIQAFEQTVEIASQAGYGMFEIVALSHLAGLRLQQGRLRAAEIGYRRALELAAIKMGKRSPVTGNALLGQGELAREWNDLDGALRYFSESAALFAQFSDFGLPIAHLSIARVKAAQGDWNSAQEDLEKARQYAQSSKATRLDDRLVDGLQAKFWIMQGELRLAEQWAHERGLIEHSLIEVVQTSGRNAAGSEFVYTDYLTLARLYLAQRKFDAALQVLESLLNLAESMGYMRRVIQTLVVKANALQQKKEIEPAVDALRQALVLAEPEGYQRVFLDEGEGLVQLLYQVIAQGHSTTYAKKLLAAFSPTASSASAAAPAAGLLEALSQREREVLTLIAEGLSNQEIAVRLTISLSTVKGHTASIYGKLGVNSRTRAISEAARLGILNP